jgi:hypothetical protein
MRLNARRFRSSPSPRCMAVLFSLALGWLVWRFARRLGPRGACSRWESAIRARPSPRRDRGGGHGSRARLHRGGLRILAFRAHHALARAWVWRSSPGKAPHALQRPSAGPVFVLLAVLAALGRVRPGRP